MSLFVETSGTVFSSKLTSKGDAYVLRTLSIPEGKDKDGKNTYSSWNAHFIGKAKEAALKLEDKTYIRFKGYVKKTFNRDTKKEYIFLSVYEFEVSDGKVSGNADKPADADIDVTDQDLPF